jgi:Flp pilus assembly protein TadD
MVLTWKQVQYWKNSISLFEHSLEVTSNNWLCSNNLGIALARKGNVDMAVKHFQKALQINPNFSYARDNLKKALLLQERNQ